MKYFIFISLVFVSIFGYSQTSYDSKQDSRLTALENQYKSLEKRHVNDSIANAKKWPAIEGFNADTKASIIDYKAQLEVMSNLVKNSSIRINTSDFDTAGGLLSPKGAKVDFEPVLKEIADIKLVATWLANEQVKFKDSAGVAFTKHNNEIITLQANDVALNDKIRDSSARIRKESSDSLEAFKKPIADTVSALRKRVDGTNTAVYTTMKNTKAELNKRIDSVVTHITGKAVLLINHPDQLAKDYEEIDLWADKPRPIK